MNKQIWIFAVFATLVLACGNADNSDKSVVPTSSSSDAVADGGANVSNETTTASVVDPAFKPFDIYTDKGSILNHYVPSGFMPDGKCVTLNETWQEGCHSGKTCIRVVYGVQCSREDQQWAGVYWLNPANNWGHRKGGFNLTGAQKLTFWAKGESGGEQISEFSVGGIANEYPDTDLASIGPVILSSEWRQYTIDLRGKDLSYISGGFAWTANVTANPESCIFYLDDIRFE
ncbi:MAG: hypothetical protein HQL23_02900 [Candidatus Omnitrophica bacterium]|nr:hypothetical protein [Candidatus Omnitrophota bacterium]